MKKYYVTQRFLQFVFIVLLGSLSCFLPQPVFAGNTAGENTNNHPQQTITGTVKDAGTGKSLSGATITVKGTNQSTTTDANGAFTLTVSDERATLVISFVGYQTQEVAVSGNSPVSISLQPSGGLTEVVVVGYGTQSKKDITGSVKSVRSEAFNKGIINAPQQLLQGKVAGVNVTSASGEPGGILNITVRGPGGIRTGSTPLFVIDGFPMDNSSTGGGDPLNFINPNDIESIDVLKDASATAIYGSRGANGVIIITTRKGRPGATSMSWSSSVGISKMARPLEVLSADEFRKEVPAVGGTLDDKGGNTDWQKEVTRTALTHQHNLSLSGGSEKLTYYASFGALLQQGIIKKNDLNRYSGRFNASQRFLEDRLIVDVNMAVAQTRNNRPPIGTILGSAISNNPTYPVYDASGKPAAYPNMTNPLQSLDLNKDIATINRVVGNISPSVKIIKGLTYRLIFGVDYSNSTRDYVTMPSTTPPNTGRLESFYSWNRNTLIENYLTYAFKVKEHDISALAGYSYQKIFTQGRNNSINNFSNTTVDPIYNPGLGEELTLALNRPGGFALINELQSYFGRVTYQFQGKYLATVNFRADGSSKFGENNKYGYFPSFSLGWKISEEAFMRNSFFDLLKLRAGWGMTGNQEIPSKITQPYYTSQATAANSYPLYVSGGYPAGTVYSRLANPDIQWEVSKQTNIGLDFGLLKGALTASLDVFRKVSDNILLQIIPADPVQPVPVTWTNVENMSVTNQGLEFDIDYKHKTNIGINFNVGGNFTYMTNEVKNSPFTVISSGNASGPAGLTGSTINGYVNGEPIGTFFLREWTGLDANGFNTFRDANGDKLFDDKDRIAAGTALPKVMYNFYGTVSYKGFDLTANFNGVAGNKIYDFTANAAFYKSQLSKSLNVTREAFKYPNEALTNTAVVSTRYLKDGAYLRLNNLALGYNFNTTKLGFGKWVKSLRTSLTAQNLFVITSYDGYDPEINTDRAMEGVSSYGIDYLSYPKARSFIFSVNVSF